MLDIWDRSLFLSKIGTGAECIGTIFLYMERIFLDAAVAVWGTEEDVDCYDFDCTKPCMFL